MFSNDDDDDYHSAAAACVCCTCLLIRSKDDIIKLLCKQTSSPFLPHPSVATSLPCTTYSDWSFVSQSQAQDALLLPSLLPTTSPPHAVSVRFPWTPSHLVLVVPPCISASWSIIAVCVGSASGKFIALLFFFTGERVIGGSLKPYIIRKYPDISLETSESQPHIVVGCGRPVCSTTRTERCYKAGQASVGSYPPPPTNCCQCLHVYSVERCPRAVYVRCSIRRLNAKQRKHLLLMFVSLAGSNQPLASCPR